jgi:hypothetical protein
MLAAGDTSIVPTEATEPTPGSIVTEVAFETSQLKVVEPPAVILGGLAVK